MPLKHQPINHFRKTNKQKKKPLTAAATAAITAGGLHLNKFCASEWEAPLLHIREVVGSYVGAASSYGD